ncbi:hypothetical protein OG400_12495 [Micromonospora ureilytica]|uniref:hypothetical protein n=1 Tax=Micromonospora ureilytica TaxID=709868 RepID=UPI002E132B44|nr:hypothetical protein OG400_12495 [Micromonospora ureilytica]
MMIRHRTRGLTALAAALGLVAVAGCGSTSDPQGSGPSTTPSATTSPSPSPSAAVSLSPTPATSTSPPAPAEPKLGQKQATDLGDVTVYSVKFPVQAQNDVATSIRTKGTQFAVADIKACSNGTTDGDGYGFSISDFQLIDTESRTYTFWNVQVGARSPNLTDSLSSVATPRAGACKRGWLTFELPPKTRIVSVEFAPSGGLPLSWKVR